MAYCWPAIDVAASNKRDHLTKIPFSVHGSSGRVALPVDLDAPLASGGVLAVPRVSWESLVVPPDAASIATFNALVDYAQRTVDAAAGPPPSNNISMTSRRVAHGVPMPGTRVFPCLPHCIAAVLRVKRWYTHRLIEEEGHVLGVAVDLVSAYVNMRNALR